MFSYRWVESDNRIDTGTRKTSRSTYTTAMGTKRSQSGRQLIGDKIALRQALPTPRSSLPTYSTSKPLVRLALSLSPHVCTRHLCLIANDQSLEQLSLASPCERLSFCSPVPRNESPMFGHRNDIHQIMAFFDPIHITTTVFYHRDGTTNVTLNLTDNVSWS